MGVFTLLMVYVVLISVAQVWAAQAGAPRLAGYSLLAPLVAGALLPLRQTLIVVLVTVAAMSVTYGLVIDHLAPFSRVLAIGLVAITSVVGLVVCRIRLEKEERIGRLMVARDRLRLLSAASTRIGATLDVDRTAWELAEVAVPGFADFMAVDLFEGVLGGDEPPPGPVDGPVELRRVAQRSVLGDTPEAVLRPGATAIYPESSLLTQSLMQGRAVLTNLSSGDDTGEWLTRDDRRAVKARQYGFHSAIAVPLLARGTPLGVAIFVRHRQQRPFDSDDVLLAEEIGARAAVCVDNARRFTHEHRTSLTLQQSLLPRRLPDVSAVEVATRYLPATAGVGVGGDWFDVIQLSGARVALIVGDVVGHGLYASATMGRLRSAVRTLADIDLPPDELLTHVDDVLIRLRAETGQEEARGEIGATCLYAVYDPVSKTCTVARAGHPAPATVLPDGRVEFIDVPAGPPLGLGGLPFESTRVSLPEGSLLVLYTKGLLSSGDPELVRRPPGTPPGGDRPPAPDRHRDDAPSTAPDGRGDQDGGHDRVRTPGDEGGPAPDGDGGAHDARGTMAEGMVRLRRALTEPAPTLELACDSVLKSMLPGGPTDDVALLLARTRALDASHVATWDMPGDPSSVGRARELVTGRLREWGLEEAVFTTELVISELVTNAIRHAGGPIQLRVIRERSLICEVSDTSSTSPHLRRARSMDENGRGLFIVAQLTDRWGTRQTPGGKTIWAELPTTGGEVAAVVGSAV
ncbi:SpoIIE family protein phosphatase [Streptomyces sp. RFCAC02]|uniref:ATP-binding SpoIIE family protein phosphatase n=1 Tax=Streptomyces sp. RFCAC02 TaxID=2499143 RepID=UPI001F102627|nr:SpoIIE family protein phosphatase [Streptomyces sp. RFCAC02]